jgi:hypothetical protein
MLVRGSRKGSFGVNNVSQYFEKDNWCTSSATSEPNDKKPGISGGTIAGIVIGAVVESAPLATAVFFARRASKFKKQVAISKYAEGPSGYPALHPDDGYISPESEK